MPLAIRWTEPRRASSAGFTLLELVVVVAIAGVLMALLLPALTGAKEKSRRSVCGQNIRQDLMALIMYSDWNDERRLPPATDDQGAYHSIRLSDFTFTNLLESLSDESNSLYCPNLVHATGQMGGYEPGVGYTIGYSYLAVKALPPTPAKGPDQGWSGPLKADETGEVLADANYWSTASSQRMTLAPHSSGGGAVAVPMVSGVSGSKASSVPSSPVPGATSTAMGAMGGNIGSLNMSVIWKPIRSMKQWPASFELDGSSSAFGNW